MPASQDHDAEVGERLRALIQARRLSWYALARATLRDPQLAEDCLQDALLLAWRHRGEVRDLEALDAWVRQILVRRCTAARLGQPAPSLQPAPATAVEDAALERWAGATAISLIEALPARQRRAVLARLVGDLPYSDIAAELGCTEATARSLVRFGLERVRPALRRAVA